MRGGDELVNIFEFKLRVPNQGSQGVVRALDQLEVDKVRVERGG